MKHKVLYLIAVLSYYMGVDTLFYFFNRRAKRIVTFHNVLPGGLCKSDLTNGVSHSEDDFRFIVREVRKHFQFSVDVMDAKTATITFDDGFLNQYEVAGRILKEEGDIPAIVFVAGDELDNGDPANAIVVEQLLHWTAYAPDGTYGFPYCEAKRIVLTESNRGEVWVKHVRPAYASDSEFRGRCVLKMLDEQYPMARILDALPMEYRRLRLTGISHAQADELRGRGWKIGWHTKSHYPLSSLCAEEKRSEITPPLGFQDVVFSYPYGETLSVDAESVRIAESCGYPCAVSNLAVSTPLCGRFFMPRMSLPADKYLLHFKLSGTENFLRTFSLLKNRNNTNDGR